MTIHSYREQYLLVAAADHEILSVAVENFRRLFAGSHAAAAHHDFAALRQLLSQKLPDHFEYEERLIFPSLLAEHPTDVMLQAIADLCAEHRTMTTQASNLNSEITKRSLTNCTGELWIALRDFIDALEKHTAKEDALYLPPSGS